MKNFNFYLCTLITCCLCFCFSHNSLAQSTGQVNYDFLGVSFTIPDNWFGQEGDGMYLMGSNTIPGYIILLPHDQSYSLDQIKSFASVPIEIGEGSNLTLDGQLESIGQDAIGGQFTGIAEWQPAKAFLIGVTNPFGKGATIIAFTSKEQFNDQYRTFAVQLKNSLKFSQPKASPLMAKMQDYLPGKSLTYANSWGDATNGGYDKTRISLCPNGQFSYYGKATASAMTTESDIRIADMSSEAQSSEGGNGTWRLQSDTEGAPVLILAFKSGQVLSYTISKKDGKLYLNGTQYFRGEAECY